jgi:hypothetical protein
VPYKFSYAAGGDTGITYALTAGQLPPGLDLSSDGTLAGTPTKLGSYPYTVTATGTSGATAHQTDTVTIIPAIVTTIGKRQSTTAAP